VQQVGDIHPPCTTCSRTILPAAKISPGADNANEYFAEQHGAAAATTTNDCNSRHGDDRDNLMMMKMMNAPHEPILYAESGWEHSVSDALDIVTEYASVSSLSCSNCGSIDNGSEDAMVQQQQQQVQRPMDDAHHFEGEDLDLSEFLTDTFEGADVDVMAAMDDAMSELAAI
jgi:hypothetical protein